MTSRNAADIANAADIFYHFSDVHTQVFKELSKLSVDHGGWSSDIWQDRKGCSIVLVNQWQVMVSATTLGLPKNVWWHEDFNFATNGAQHAIKTHEQDENIVSSWQRRSDYQSKRGAGVVIEINERKYALGIAGLPEIACHLLAVSVIHIEEPGIGLAAPAERYVNPLIRQAVCDPVPMLQLFNLEQYARAV